MAKFNRYIIITSVLVVLFFIAAYFFQTGYNRYVINERKLNRSELHARLLKQHNEEQARKRRIIARTKSFVESASALGLERRNWDSYEVYIKEPVTFPQAKKILSQTINTDSYYFKPVSLEISKFSASESEQEGLGAPSNSAALSETEEGDIFFTLRGYFLIKQR